MTSTEQSSSPSPPLSSLHHHSNHLSLFRSKSTGTMQHVPRRLSSGSACETCRRRKTKCDGGQPCAFCASNRIECIHRPSRRKRLSPKYASKPISDTRYHHPTYHPSSSSSASSWSSSPPSSTSSVSPPPPSLLPLAMADHYQQYHPALIKQISCPSLFRNSKKKEMPSMIGMRSSPSVCLSVF
ncbi:hypothetical protein [Absidia glauca]|uniref:Zn(2)-C6 fungal-type domain-containing protein n=1 Tax=Absidia glauca TaxID=4829 RepID=A0A168P212_ABSGL|nr:hypothetical protein [Absidia glauca]